MQKLDVVDPLGFVDIGGSITAIGGSIMAIYSFGGPALEGPRFYKALLMIPHDRLWWGVAELFFYFLCMLSAVFSGPHSCADGGC